MRVLGVVRNDTVPVLHSDPVVGSLTLVKPDLHILPQRMERSFRLILHPDDETPLIDLEGWAIGNWSAGGYMPQNVGLPDMSHTTIDLSVQKDLDYSLLASNSPTIPGDTPESPLWPPRLTLKQRTTSRFSSPAACSPWC